VHVLREEGAEVKVEKYTCDACGRDVRSYLNFLPVRGLLAVGHNNSYDYDLCRDCYRDVKSLVERYIRDKREERK
jgi:hypothetical protein